MSNLNGGTDMFGDVSAFESCLDSFDLLSAGGDIWQLQHRTLSSNKVIHVCWGWGLHTTISPLDLAKLVFLD